MNISPLIDPHCQINTVCVRLSPLMRLLKNYSPRHRIYHRRRQLSEAAASYPRDSVGFGNNARVEGSERGRTQWNLNNRQLWTSGAWISRGSATARSSAPTLCRCNFPDNALPRRWCRRRSIRSGVRARVKQGTVLTTELIVAGHTDARAHTGNCIYPVKERVGRVRSGPILAWNSRERSKIVPDQALISGHFLPILRY